MCVCTSHVINDLFTYVRRSDRLIRSLHRTNSRPVDNRSRNDFRLDEQRRSPSDQRRNAPSAQSSVIGIIWGDMPRYAEKINRRPGYAGILDGVNYMGAITWIYAEL